MNIDKAAKELEIKNKELDDTKFKESLGMTGILRVTRTLSIPFSISRRNEKL